jgi:Lipocalin-like domain
MKRWMYLMPLALLIVSGSTLKAQSAGSARARLVGTWRLVSSVQNLENGKERPDPQTGTKGDGYLMYSETGRVCVVLANSDRPKWKSETDPKDSELRSAFDGLVAYCGTYEVNETEGSVVHHVEMDRVPNMAGKDRKRYYSLSGNKLVLRAAPPLPAGVREWTITWERVVK